MNATACERVTQFFFKLHTKNIPWLVRAKTKLKSCILYEEAKTFAEFEKECTLHLKKNEQHQTNNKRDRGKWMQPLVNA